MRPVVVSDDGVGRVQDGLGRAVILLQADEAGIGELLLKIQDIFDRRAAEAVNALVIVADHANILPPPRQKRGQEILQVVRILVLRRS